MAGNKNSGRKSARDEKLRARVIEMAWLRKEKEMSDSDATQIVLKDMVTKLAGHDGDKLYPQPLLGGKSNVPDNNSSQKTTNT